MVAEKKIVKFQEKKAYKKFGDDISSNELERFDETYRKLRDFFVNPPQEMLDLHAKKRIIELERENKNMAKRLNNSFPTHIVTYLIICSFAMGISITLLFLTYVCGIHLINPYYIICALLISLTLFCTAAVAIKDWKEYIKNGG